MTELLDGQTIGGRALRLVRKSCAAEDTNNDDSVALQLICLDYERQLRQRIAYLSVVVVGYWLHCWAGRIGGLPVDALVAGLVVLLLYRVCWLIKSGQFEMAPTQFDR